MLEAVYLCIGRVLEEREQQAVHVREHGRQLGVRDAGGIVAAVRTVDPQEGVGVEGVPPTHVPCKCQLRHDHRVVQRQRGLGRRRQPLRPAQPLMALPDALHRLKLPELVLNVLQRLEDNVRGVLRSLDLQFVQYSTGKDAERHGTRPAFAHATQR